MKLSFSTKGWHTPTFPQFCEVAEDLRFQGIELHNIYNRLFTDKDGAFHDYAAAATRRRLFEKGLDIPCIDTVCDASEGATDRAVEEITRCLSIAANLGIPYVRLKAADAADREAAIARVTALVAQVLPAAEEQGVTLLIETSGLFASTAALRDLLDGFACDDVAALWHWSAAYFGGGESPEQVIKNLGAYVRHVHVSDAKTADGGLEYCLLGEGDLPVKDMMLALRSVNYDGFLSLVWDPAWCPELDDMEIILTQFVHYMRQFGDTSRNESALYWNRAHTGKYVWEKNRLIDCTFSQVLDRMVEEFPDQYAFKYTTLDYTRTYAQFRDDVDECARALISCGVKAGTHVAVWASNVPQWYIAFWATVKLGAVLVTVNTAYKIHEIEYLLRQSDSHTLIMTEGAKDCHYGEIVAELCPELAQTKEGKPLHARRLPFLRNVITVGYKQKGCMEWKDFIARSTQVPLSEVHRLAAKV
ncbi:MAG: AMP-binding protein, partial [Clostridia bacterium]|nr:AMP-binding protein [Clostridia bacterium]